MRIYRVHGLQLEHASDGPESNCRAALEASNFDVGALRRRESESRHDESGLALREISGRITHVRPSLIYRIIDSPDVYHLDVELEQKHIAILHDVFLSFRSHVALFASVLPSAIGDEGVE
jgi:hypothetical protein